MGDIMHPLSFPELLERMEGEFSSCGSIFGIPENMFFTKRSEKSISFFEDSLATPLGPAAGPHTQLAQNIITAYLTGGRFFELKTVQKLDQLELEKPCIDAEDEAYNTEWSTELTVRKAYQEYVKAWISIHLLERVFKLSEPRKKPDKKSVPFAFNMSVGYDLAGIQLPKIDTFINDLTDARNSKYFVKCLEELADRIGKSEMFPRVPDLPDSIPSRVCSSLTISTLHGCPPEEIQRIAEYCITEKQLHTMVKLNPTLLGYDRARELLDETGFHHVKVKEETFTHDLQYGDALTMIKALLQTAEKNGVAFGVKLSNTLPSVNKKGVLTDEEMYMSGRALYPLTVNLAADLSEDIQGPLNISYCGGVSSLNTEALLKTGVRPITMATDLLKPGGYLRLKAAADLLEDMETWELSRFAPRAAEVMTGTIPDALETLARKAPEEPWVKKTWRGNDTVSISRRLPLFDCYAAPCKEACPIGQDIPEYIQLVGAGKYPEALELIYEKNPLPAITGTICDHQCMYHCTRLDYEGAVHIRDMKLQAALKGYRQFTAGKAIAETADAAGPSIAVIGAGPAGLATAYFLRRYGFSVTVLEKETSAGGVVRHVLPRFRLPEEAVRQDIDFIESMGVIFEFGVAPETTLEKVKERGFDIVCLAVGAEKGNVLDLEGSGPVVESLDFLRAVHAFETEEGSNSVPITGKKVVVIGGGNTAIDSARAALRLPGVESVTMCYRRTENEMPADREEYENGREDGVRFAFLLQPEVFSSSEGLQCRVMELVEPDDTGRKRPVPTDKVRNLEADTVISAIGEHVDTEFLKRFGTDVSAEGALETDPETLQTKTTGVYLLGDARTGPSTVVECIAEARKAADAIAESAGVSVNMIKRRINRYGSALDTLRELSVRKTLCLHSCSHSEEPATDRDTSREVEKREQSRCLECDLICNKCVEVCPNRANIAVAVPEQYGFADLFQILHIDAFCNECGNCATFCPYNGKPYLDKLTVFSSKEDFEHSTNSGMYLGEDGGVFRFEDTTGLLKKKGEGLFTDGDVQKQLIDVINYVYRIQPYLFGRVENGGG